MDTIKITSAPEGFKDVTDRSANGRCFVHLSLPIAICTDDDGSGPEIYFVKWDDKESEARREQPVHFDFAVALNTPSLTHGHRTH
jgi:hypothetical protein